MASKRIIWSTGVEGRRLTWSQWHFEYEGQEVAACGAVPTTHYPNKNYDYSEAKRFSHVNPMNICPICQCHENVESLQESLDLFDNLDASLHDIESHAQARQAIVEALETAQAVVAKVSK